MISRGTIETIRIDKLVHGGQGLARLQDGKTVFCWNALPGELIQAQIIRVKHDYVEAIAQEIVEPSKDRITPKEPDSYLGSSPWQMMLFAAENRYKHDVVAETFQRQHLALPKFACVSDGREWGYRNKMEYSFYGDETGLHLAQFVRGSHKKVIVEGSALAMPAIDQAAGALLALLHKNSVRASTLKSLILRCNQAGDVFGALFIKEKGLSIKLILPEGFRGLSVYYSNPKSPASVTTKLLAELGDTTIVDTLLDRELRYRATSFFQVNVPMFQKTLKQLQLQLKGTKRLVDLYSGVGSIGLSLNFDETTLVEADPLNIEMAQQNAHNQARVVHATSESALEYIDDEVTLMVDPPRAGLHQRLTDRILDVCPPVIAYLSCNPSTHARDLELLSTAYELQFFEAYNYFPRTPHIEALAVLRLK